jgi:hypothetical protein
MLRASAISSAVPVDPDKIMVTQISTGDAAGLNFTPDGFSVTAGQSVQHLSVTLTTIHQ